MLGSEYRQYGPKDGSYLSLFPIKLNGRTVWVWRFRAADGKLKAQSQGMFQDYVACLCDALRHADLG